MHNSTTLSCPLPRKIVQDKKKVLPVRLSFEVKITDVINFYELKFRMCANGSRMIKWQDYELFYSPTADGEPLRFMIAMASEENKELSFIEYQTHSKQMSSWTQKIDNVF